MKIQQLDLTVRDLVAGYRDDGGCGVAEILIKRGRFYVSSIKGHARIVIRRGMI